MRAKAWKMAAVFAGLPLASVMVPAHLASAATGPRDVNVLMDYTITGLTGTLDLHYGNVTEVAYGAAVARDGSMTSVQFNDPDDGNDLIITAAAGSLTAQVHERVLIPEQDTAIHGTASFSGGTVEVRINSSRPVSVPNGSFSFETRPFR